jgi:hypothetical protein
LQPIIARGCRSRKCENSQDARGAEALAMIRRQTLADAGVAASAGEIVG